MSTSGAPSVPNFVLHPNETEARAAAELLFQRTTLQIRALLPLSADILHIGATAIPGCLTKGDLDIVVRVAAEDFAAADEALARRFARNTGSKRTDGFSSFEDATTWPHLGLQLTAVGGEEDYFHLFAEALMREPDLVAQYNALKRQCDGMPMDTYRAIKGDFIETVLNSQR